MLPVAHVGHYLWVLYLVPILIVAAAIVRNFISQRRAANAPPAGGDYAEDSAGRQSPESETEPAGRAAGT